MTRINSGAPRVHQSSQAATAQSTQKSEPAGAGYSHQSLFEDYKKGVNDYKYEGFSQTRLDTMKKDAIGEMEKWLQKNPNATEDEANKALESIGDKMVGSSIIEKNMFDQLWNDLQSQMQKSLDEMKKNFGE